MQAVESARREAEANAARLKDAEGQAAQIQKARQEGEMSTAEEKKALEKLRAEQEAAARSEREAIAKIKAEQEAQARTEREAVAKFKAEQEALLQQERESISKLKAEQEAAAAEKARQEATASQDASPHTQPIPSEDTPAESTELPGSAVNQEIKASPAVLPQKESSKKEKAPSSVFGALVIPSPDLTVRLHVSNLVVLPTLELFQCTPDLGSGLSERHLANCT